MDKGIEGTDVAVGAVGSEGERRSSTLSPPGMTRASRRWRLGSGAPTRAAGIDAGLRERDGDPKERALAEAPAASAS